MLRFFDMSLDDGLLALSKRDLARLVMQLRNEVEELKKRLLAYENAHTPPSLRKGWRKPPSQGLGKTGAPKGHEGTTRPEPTPDKVVDVAPLKRCPSCNTKLEKPTGFEKRIIEEIPEPQPVLAIQYNLPRQTCPCCGLEIITTHPDCPDTGRFGFNTQANVALLKYDGRLPHRKVAEALKRDHQLEITPATVLELNNRTAKKLSPQYLKLIGFVRKSSFIFVDETSLRVAGSKYWVWIFTTEKATLVVIRPSRGKNVLQEILGKTYAGIIICDGHKAYPNYTNRLQRCWAHLLREAEFIAQQFPVAVPFHKKLLALYRRLVKRYRQKLSNVQRYYFWRNAVLRLETLLKEATKKDHLKKLVAKIQNGCKSWFTFLLYPEIEPTNNRAERALRETVVQRKIFGCLRNQKGTTNHETIMSLLATGKQRGLNPKTELLNALRS